MSSTVTITAKTGPGLTDTAEVLRNVTGIAFDLGKRTVDINQGGVIKNYDLSTVTTVTFSISGADYTVTIS